MDFSYSEEQQAIAELARQIFSEKATHERQREIERGGAPRFDRDLWTNLAEAGLLGTVIPETCGGAGLGFLELAAILEQAGRRTAPVPLLETLALGALPIARFGSESQKQRLLPRVATGEAVLTAALLEEVVEPGRPTTSARFDGEGWILSGHKICVPAGSLAEVVLVPAETAAGQTGVFLVPTNTRGVRLEELRTTSGQPEANLSLEDVRLGADAVLGTVAEGARIVEWIRERATAAQCAFVLGLCEEALQITAEYAKTRRQFGQPIATFQAVGHRAADAYIDTEGVRLTALQAAWRIDAGLPASRAVAIAKYWASVGGQRVVHAAQHLHGGIGVDRDYPLHRYFLHAKQVELSLGGATAQLLRLGRMLAEETD
jgi:alkylation response protein AidB-like acyl-CoA dehydrogenase